MLDTVPPYLLTPLTPEAVRWHLPAAEYRDPDAIEVTCGVIAESVETAWNTVKTRAAENRHADPALHRLLLNIHIEGLDATPDGCFLALYVSSRGIHDLVHARTGARFTEELSKEARIAVSVADCDSRLRWTRGIRCHWVEPKPAAIEPNWDAIRVHREAIIDGRIGKDDPQAASWRLLLALEDRAGIRHTGASWVHHPKGMFTAWFSPDNARRLIELGAPAAPHLAEQGAMVGFTFTDQECHDLTETVIAVYRTLQS
jgi:hypothetical protein